MSEYKPITGELRDWFEHAYSYDVGETPWFGWKSTIEQMLDAIDSIHAALEAENERLRGEWDFWESTHVELPKDGEALSKQLAEWIESRGLVTGPLDANGELWHRGDMSDSQWGEIESIAFDGYHWQVCGHDTSAPWIPADSISHYRPDTWERIIEDAMGRYSDADADALVARCKALAGDAE